MYSIKRGLVAFLMLLIVIASFSAIITQGKTVAFHECKDILAVGDSTAGDYNLLLKVRDPSRPGPQVLCIVPAGYEYTYPLPPWKKTLQRFEVKHKFIGVATLGDAPPNIVKAGIALSDAGIAYGDADSPSYWINPSPNAWDDFDWIRYACQTADNEDKAVELLTSKAVDELHAPAVSENLFVVGPKKAYVIEADAVRYSIKNVDDIRVMSNYPQELWKYRVLKRLFIANSFNAVKDKIVKRGSTVHLGALLGIKVVKIENDVVTLRLFPVGKPVPVEEGLGAVLGPFWVEVVECSNGRARIKVMYKFKAWEDEVKKRVMERYGKITVQDMMNWSRLHSTDLKGLRGLCERENKAAAVCKIPYNQPEVLSCMWFAPDQCSGIFIPVHICCTSIYKPYTDGSAAELSKNILHLYGHGNATQYIKRVEQVLLTEMNHAEKIAQTLLKKGENISTFMTNIDIGIQKQAYITQQILIAAKNTSNGEMLLTIWNSSYTNTLSNLKTVFSESRDKTLKNLIANLAVSIAQVRWNEINFTSNVEEKTKKTYKQGMALMSEGKYAAGCETLQRFLKMSENTTFEHTTVAGDESKYNVNYNIVILLTTVVLITVIMFIYITRPKRN